MQLDARPSDAIALAIRFGCPIFTTPKVISQVGIAAQYPDSPASKRLGDLSTYTLPELKELLKRILAAENYERASEIRDAMKKLE